MSNVNTINNLCQSNVEINSVKMSNVGFTGTRVGMTPAQQTGLQRLFQTLTMASFHHGDCVGADAEAHALVATHTPSVVLVLHPPLHKAQRAFCASSVAREPQEYLKRNQAIVNETDFLIAAPAEMQEQMRSGTWATIRYARKHHKTIYIIYPDGSIQHHHNEAVIVAKQ